MIDCYSNIPNPCSFCVGKKVKDNTVLREDYLEFGFDGNDTKLFIKESSVDGSKPSEDELEKENAQDEVGSEDTHVHLTVLSSSNKTERSTVGVGFTKSVSGKKPFQELYNKKWSGKTYFEEAFRRIRLKEQAKELEDATKRRKIWKQFQRELARDRRRDLIRSSGPEWWQEPSKKQVNLAIRLNDVLKADYEEGVTGRTRQWLMDLGVTARVTPKQVRSCMKLSFQDPIDFLLETHTVILKSQLNVKKKKGDLEKPFSINERLLLSAVCVLQLPTFLTILHYVLPPPKPYSKVKHIQELLFGDLDDEQIRYFTPYMEPLPFRNPKHFQKWAFDKVFRALLPSVLSLHYEDTTKGNFPIARETLSAVKLSLLSGTRLQELQIFDKVFDSHETKMSDGSTTPSVSWLISHCIANRKNTGSLAPCIDEEALKEIPKFFNRHLARSISAGYKCQIVSVHQTVVDSSTSLGVETPEAVTETTETNRESEKQSDFVAEGVAEDSTARHSTTTDPRYGTQEFSKSVWDSPQPEDNPGHVSQDLSRSSHKRLSEENSLKGRSVTSLTGANKVEENEHEIGEEQYVQDNLELEKLWNIMKNLPEDKQLQYAINYLAKLGEPLAQLPRIHRLPNVQRWLEMRKGKNRILSQTAKTKLMRRSREMWKLAPVGCTTRGPTIKCSKRKERNLTWDNKKWLERQINNETRDYYSRIKTEKVDNSRAYFPTMINHYDYGSKLNRNFRDVFFTYMPAREADTFVYRPWQPLEVKK